MDRRRGVGQPGGRKDVVDGLKVDQAVVTNRA